MAQYLGSAVCGMVAYAHKNVANACTSAVRLVERKVVLTVQVVQFIIEQGEALSASACSQVAVVMEPGLIMMAAIILCAAQLAAEQAAAVAEKVKTGWERAKKNNSDGGGGDKAGRRPSSKRPDKKAEPTLKNLGLVYREAFEVSGGTADPSPEESLLSSRRREHVVVLTARLLADQAFSACWGVVSRFVPTTRHIVERLDVLWGV